MSGRLSALAALLLGGAATSPATTTAATGNADPLADLELDDAVKASLTEDLKAVVQQATAGGEAKGFQAGTARAVEVMGSDQGKANPVGALALLGNEKLAALTAAELIAAIPAGPAAAAPAAATTTAEEPAPAGAPPKGGAEAAARLAASPAAALGNRGAADPAIDGAGDDGKGKATKEETTSLWAGIQGTKGDTRIGAAQ